MAAIELFSPLPPEECEARLRESTDRDGLLSWSSSWAVVGRVSGQSVRLRKRIGYRNSFQTFLTGSLEGCDGSTVFRGKAGMHPFVAGLMALWFGLLVFIGGAGFVAGVGGLFGGRGHPLGMVGLPVGLAFWGGLVWFGRWLARNEEAFLIGFLAEVIAARRAPEAEPVTPADGGA